MTVIVFFSYCIQAELVNPRPLELRSCGQKIIIISRLRNVHILSESKRKIMERDPF